MEEYYKRTIKRFLAASAYVLLLHANAAMGQAPDSKKEADPLAKPTLWASLAGHPTDSAVWSQYYSKPLICLSPEEKKQWKELQRHLLDGLGEVVIEGKTDHVDWDAEMEVASSAEANMDVTREQEMIARETETYLARLEQSFVAETSMVRELKQNVAMNFFIIEEIYAEEFQELGVEYVGYLDMHPKRDYSKEKWLHEKEKELTKLKKKHFKELEKQIRKNAHNHHKLTQTP